MISDIGLFFMKSDSSKTVTTPRWEIIQNALLRDIKTSRDLERAILSYNPKYAKEWKFKTLHTLFEEVLICLKYIVDVSFGRFMIA